MRRVRDSQTAVLFFAFLLLGPAWSAVGQTITELPVPAVSPGPMIKGPDGNLWYVASDEKIARITTSGSVTEFVLRPVTGFVLSDLTSGPDGHVWFLRSLTYLDFGPDSSRIGRVTSSGDVREFPLDEIPGRITAGPDGNIWFTGPQNQTIHRMTTAGQFIRPSLPVGQGGSLHDITTGPDGKVWFTDFTSNLIGRITTAGVLALSVIPTPSSEPLAITSGPDGNVWFIEYSANKIGRITPAGQITEFSIPTPQAGLVEITAGPDGNLWFTENSADKLGRITTAGIVTEFPLPPGSRPFGITAGPDGNIWFTEAGTSRIAKLTIATAPPADRRILPVVGSTPGASGTFFRTSVQLNNPGSASMTGRIVFHPSGRAGSDTDPALPYSLTPGQTLSIADLLPAMGVSGLGSADIEITSGNAPVTTARVFNDAGPSGTTGFTEEAMRAEEALWPGQTGVLLIPSDIRAARFNVGVRTLEEGASVTFTLRNAAGSVLETSSRAFPPTYHEQQGAVGFLRVSELPPGGSIAIAVTSGSAILYAATVDNSTGDPSLQIARTAP